MRTVVPMCAAVVPLCAAVVLRTVLCPTSLMCCVRHHATAAAVLYPYQRT